jgi:hypothetical protein
VKTPRLSLEALKQAGNASRSVNAAESCSVVTDSSCILLQRGELTEQICHHLRAFYVPVATDLLAGQGKQAISGSWREAPGLTAEVHHISAAMASGDHAAHFGNPVFCAGGRSFHSPIILPAFARAGHLEFLP